MSSVRVMTATEAKVLCEQFVEKMRIPTFEGYNHQDASEVLSKLSLIVQNILKQPANEKYRAIPLDNKVILNLLDKYPGAMEYLEILGFQKMQTSKGAQQYVLGMGKENPELLHVGLNVLAENISALQGEAPSSQSKESFNIFQSNILRLSNQMLPTSENLLREKKVEQIVKQREEEVIKAGIPDRELKVFERETSQQVKLEDLPENYARRIDLEILKEVSASVKENKRRSERFQTKAMRDLEMLEKSKVYTKTCICVQFPDDLVVQATFSPLERISDVEDQIRSCMENPENSKFYLFERPQNVRLSSESTLRDLNMVPRARLFVGWEGQAPEGEYIREDLISTPNQKHNVVRETKKQRSIFNFFK